jgi:hypothetical protein
MRPYTETILFGLAGLGMLLAIAYFFLLYPRYSHVGPSNQAAAVGSVSDQSADNSTADIADTNITIPFSTTTYQYKLLQTVDTCSLNMLGVKGWKLVDSGTDPNTGDYLTLIPGRDELCQKQGIYQGLVWAVLEQATSSTYNTITTDTASKLQYKIVTGIDPCTFKKLGSDGWHATQFGTTLTFTGGYDETCRSSSVPTLDWVMFERPLLQ